MLQQLGRRVGSPIPAASDDGLEEIEQKLREKTIGEMRDTLLQLVDLIRPDNPNIARVLGLIRKTAESGADMLSSLGTGGIPMVHDEFGQITPAIPLMSAANPGETFGAQIASQFTSAMSQNSKPQGIEHLVNALATAKEAGLTEEAVLIQKKLCTMLKREIGEAPEGLGTVPEPLDDDGK